MIRKLSKKRASQNRKYLQRRKTFLEERSECEAGLPGCTGEATNVHHQRGRIGDLLLDESNWLPCCMSCHDKIHNEPVLALEKNLSKSRLAK